MGAAINVISLDANIAQQLASKLAAANQGGAPGGGYPPPGQGQGAPGGYVSFFEHSHVLRSSRAVLTVSLFSLGSNSTKRIPAGRRHR
ncbi:hypothetical protein SLS60_004429 [Paraconiothyrium brasiliense]|uniref:Uncharacterized protein n=1 Tax=Paraconiothyrium brasiliense TaxID=300254 RepID=A0ABR3RL83_9PLEO